jgi:hypothetical protein
MKRWRLERWIPIPKRDHEGAWTSCGRAKSDEEARAKLQREYARHRTVVRATAPGEQLRISGAGLYHERTLTEQAK